MSESVRLRCPDYSSGICTKNGCNGFLVRPRWTGTAEDGADLYSGACPTNDGVGYFNNVRAFIDPSKPIDFDDAVQRLYQQELAERKQKWLAIRDALIDYGLTIPIEEWPVPKKWNDKNVEFVFQHLREQIKHSLDQICDKDSVMRPDDHWEELIPLILSLDLDCHAYSIMQEYGDGIYKTVTLADGETLNISRNSNNEHISYMPLDMCKEELDAYIDAGVEISRQVNSTTRKTWRKVKQLFYDHRHELPENKRVLDEIAPMLRDARTELILDIEDAAEEVRHEAHSEPQADKCIKAKPTTSRAYPFITHFDEKNRLIKMDVYQRNDEQTTVAIRVIGGDMAWNVIRQFARAKSSPVKIKNPRKNGPLNLPAMFKPTKNTKDNRELFYRFLKTVGKGCEARYELSQRLVR